MGKLYLCDMNKDFTPYKQSVELKELGFDESCIATIDQTEYIHIKGTKYPAGGSMMYDTIDCPTLSKAFRWFREKYNLFGQVNIHTYFIYDISNDEFKSAKQYDKSTKNYEEAEIACLKKLIEIVKNK